MTTTLEALNIACPGVREIEFDEIRKGDTIARHDGDDDYIIRTAHHLLGRTEWVCHRDYRVAKNDDGRVRLIHRPERMLPTKQGALVRWCGHLYCVVDDVNMRDIVRGHLTARRVIENGEWESVYLTTEEPGDE